MYNLINMFVAKVDPWLLLSEEEEGFRADITMKEFLNDEKSFGKGQSYVSILYDPSGKRVLDVAPKRDEEAVKGLYKSLSAVQWASVKAIRMDFWQAFINGAQSNIPGADSIHDKFHIMKYMNEAVDKVRRTEQAKLKKEKDETLTGTKYLFLKNRENFREQTGVITKILGM